MTNPKHNPVKQPKSPSRPPRQSNFKTKLEAARNSFLYKCLIFGPSRSGKTTFAATAGYGEDSAPTLLLDFEGGSGSSVGIPNVVVSSMRSWQDFNEACEYIVSPDNEFKTVIVDSISELHVFSLLNIIDHELSTNAMRRERGDENTAEQSDYGKSMVQLRRFLRVLRDLPVHVIVTALSKTEEYPREGTVRVPAMFGQMAGEIVGMFPIVGYLVNEKERIDKTNFKYVRRLYLQNTEGMRVGVRKPITAEFPDSIANPTVPKLFAELNRAYKGE